MSEVLEAFTDAFSEAASKTAGAFLEETVKERLKQFSYSALFVTASSEVLKPNAHGAFILIPGRSRFSWDPRRQFFAELVASRLCLTRRDPIQGDLP